MITVKYVLEEDYKKLEAEIERLKAIEKEYEEIDEASGMSDIVTLLINQLCEQSYHFRRFRDSVKKIKDEEKAIAAVDGFTKGQNSIRRLLLELDKNTEGDSDE